MPTIPIDQIRDTSQAPDISCEPQSIEPRLDTETAGRLAAALKALSHPVRLQMMDILSRGERQVCVCDIEQYFELTQPTISHHLKVLRESGLIEAEQKGLWVYYYVRPTILAEIKELLSGFGG